MVGAEPSLVADFSLCSYMVEGAGELCGVSYKDTNFITEGFTLMT